MRRCDAAAGVTSKTPHHSMDQSVAEGAEPAAATWLSSSEVDLDGIQASWDSVSQLDIPEGYERPLVRRCSPAGSLAAAWLGRVQMPLPAGLCFQVSTSGSARFDKCNDFGFLQPVANWSSLHDAAAELSSLATPGQRCIPSVWEGSRAGRPAGPFIKASCCTLAIWSLWVPGTSAAGSPALLPI